VTPADDAPATGSLAVRDGDEERKTAGDSMGRR
jgi:hypothetical protein